MLVWRPHPDGPLIFFVISGLWGIGDAVWQTQINGETLEIPFYSKSLNKFLPQRIVRCPVQKEQGSGLLKLQTVGVSWLRDSLCLLNSNLRSNETFHCDWSLDCRHFRMDYR